jgi:WD40 repeat protein
MSFSSEPSHRCSQDFQNHSSPCFYRCIATLKGNASYISSFAVDRGDSLYVASSDGHIKKLWPLDMNTEVKEDEQSSSTVAITDSSIRCLLATSKGLVSAHQDGKIRVWRAGRRNVRCRLVLRAFLPTVTDCLRTFLLPKNYVEVRRHRKRTWVHHVDAVTALALSPDGADMYSVSWDRSLKAWRMDILRCVESVAAAHNDAINAVAVSPDGCVFTGSADKTVKAWRRRPGQRKLALVGTMARHEAAVNALALGGAGGQVLYSGACDKTIIVWEGVAGGGASMAATATLRGHAKAVLCLAAAGDVVCSGSADRTVRVWRRGVTTAAGYTCLAVLDGHTAAVKSLAVVSKTGGDRDGSCDECFSAAVVCSESLDSDVKIWKVNVSCL